MNKKKCIAVFPDGTWKMFTSMEQGALFFGVNNNSISTVCRRNRQTMNNGSLKLKNNENNRYS